jgi:hypothetical protein
MFSGNIVCPFCLCPVNVIAFGFGWLGICCKEIIYNSDQPPTNIEDYEGETMG